MQKNRTRTFWERIKEAALDAKLPATQTYIAEKLLGIKQPSISDWNKPGGYPTIDNTVVLAKKLGVCVEWLLTERGPKRPIPQDQVAQRIWDVWPRLSDTAKGELVGLATARASEDSLTSSPGQTETAVAAPDRRTTGRY